MSSKRFAAGVSAALLATVIVARLVSTFFPRFHWEPTPGLHIHHYVYGIFILTVAGYLALRFKGPRATTWISLLYGLGVGLTFDEFGMWFNPPFVRGVRWNRDGLIMVALLLAALGLLQLIVQYAPRWNARVYNWINPRPRAGAGADPAIRETAETFSDPAS